LRAAPPLKGCGSRWIKWAELLKSVSLTWVFLTDVLLCRLCGGERRIIAQIDEGPVARKILAHLGLPIGHLSSTKFGVIVRGKRIAHRS